MSGSTHAQDWRLRRSGSWLELMPHSLPRPEHDPGQLGRPGLWRSVQTHGGRELVFELPAGLALGVDGAPLESLLAWAGQSLLGELASDWQAPDPQQVEEWIDPGRLSLRARTRLAQGRIDCSESCLRLVFPELARLEPALPEARARWLDALCLDVQARWRLVRLGVVDRRLRAEVDLSGAPAPHAQRLFELALEALVCALGRLLPPLAILSDAGAGGRALDREPWWSGSAWLESPSPTPNRDEEEKQQ